MTVLQLAVIRLNLYALGIDNQCSSSFPKKLS